MVNILFLILVTTNVIVRGRSIVDDFNDDFEGLEDFEDFVDDEDHAYKLNSFSNVLEDTALDKEVEKREPFLTQTDFDNGDAIDLDTEVPEGEDPLNDAINNGRLFEGDIELSKEQAEIIGNKTVDRNAITKAYRKWPKSNGLVKIPYFLNDHYNTKERAIIARATREIETKSCIRFVPKTKKQTVYLNVHRGQGCSSPVGRQSRRMDVSLGNGCVVNVGTPIHEFMHAIGWWHEQSRPDRDNYIDIYWQNINENMKYNFEKCTSCSTQNHPYDYDSVMHYHTTAFSKNGRQTMARKNCPNCKLGQKDGLSALDVKGLNLLYGCSSTGGGGNTGGGTGSGGNTGGGTSGGGNTGGGSSCSNKKSSCAAHVKLGRCETYVTWMKKNCGKTCGFCSNCRDIDRNCSYHEEKGRCKSYVPWMKQNCKKACGFCS